MLGRRPGQREQGLVLDLAEIGPGKQLGREDHLRARIRGLFDQGRNGGDVLPLVMRAEGELEGGDGDLGHADPSKVGAAQSPLGQRHAGPASQEASFTTPAPIPISDANRWR